MSLGKRNYKGDIKAIGNQAVRRLNDKHTAAIRFKVEFQESLAERGHVTALFHIERQHTESQAWQGKMFFTPVYVKLGKRSESQAASDAQHILNGVLGHIYAAENHWAAGENGWTTAAYVLESFTA